MSSEDVPQAISCFIHYLLGELCHGPDIEKKSVYGAKFSACERIWQDGLICTNNKHIKIDNEKWPVRLK